jgi:hypothetical protein
MAFFPGLILSLAIFGFNVLGERCATCSTLACEAGG